MLDLPEVNLAEQMGKMQWENNVASDDSLASLLDNLLADYYTEGEFH